MARNTIDIVHDLANSLTAIRGSADAMQREIDANSGASRNIVRIINSTDSAMALTRELRAALHPEGTADHLPWP